MQPEYPQDLPPVYFYLPVEDFPTDMPGDADHYWIGFRRGIYCWTLQTYLHLRNSGFPCQLVDTLPDHGMILAHWDSLPTGMIPSAKQLFVCFQADRARHSYAQIHIVQNPEGLRRDLMVLGDRFLLAGQDYYMPLWTQPGLIPRNQNRGDKFENLCFFGLEQNLLPEFQEPTWAEELKKMGMTWKIVSDFDQWADYSQVDAILAVRSFQDTSFTYKPATKLYNAWHAGVPAILGRESAYRAERKSELDYIEVQSVPEVLDAIRYLKENAGLRQAMFMNAKLRAEETQKSRMISRWTNLITSQLCPLYLAWTENVLYRQSFIFRRKLALETRQTRKNLQKLRNRVGLRTAIKRILFR